MALAAVLEAYRLADQQNESLLRAIRIHVAREAASKPSEGLKPQDAGEARK